MSDTLSFLPDYRRPSAAMLARIDVVAVGGPAGRWRPHRLIVQNWWLWDYQEFYFGRGWQLFRGPNMAGKSLLLTTVVPLLFDGDKRRHRLDTFGGDGRNAEYYLLGASDATPDSDFYYEERIGYAALEFRHSETSEHRTIGIGLHGRRVGAAAPDSDFWGFVVRDGRRIGHDLSLTNERTGVPLTRMELEEALGANPVVERPITYQEAVNEALFGFRSLDDFRSAMDITLHLRRPGLNKDMTPEKMCALLSESLPEIDADVLDQVAGTLEDIDRTRKSIEDTERHLKAAQQVDKAVGEYVNQVAQRRAFQYLAADEKRDTASTDLASAGESLAHEERKIGEAETRLREIDQAEAAARGRKQELERSEAYTTQGRLEELEAEVAGSAEAVRREQGMVVEREGAILKGEDKQKSVRDEWRSEVDRQHARVGELRTEGEAARWRDAGEYADRVDAVLGALRGPDSEDPGPLTVAVLEALGEHRVECLRGAEVARREVDGAEQAMETGRLALERAQQERNLAEEKRARAEAGLDEARMEAVGAVRTWAEATVEVHLPKETKNAIFDALHAYADHAADPTALIEPADRLASQLREQVESQSAQEQVRLAEAERHRDQLRGELADLEAVPWVPPVPRPGQERVRAALLLERMAFAPLFQSVDVRPGVPAAAALAVEAALESSGLLDALIIAEGDRDRASTLIASVARETIGGDRWVDAKAPAAPGQTLFDVLVPVPCGVPTADVERVLRSIRLGAVGLTMSMVGEDGSWRLGVLGGAAGAADETALRFLGETNRRRVREEKIRTLHREISAATAEISQVQSDITALSQRVETIRQELRNLRALVELARLRNSAAELTNAADFVGRMTERVSIATVELDRRRAALLQARSAFLEAVREVPEAKDLPAPDIRSLVGHTRAALQTARSISQEMQRFVRLRQHFRDAGADVQSARKALGEARTLLDAAGVSLKEKQSQRDTLRDKLQALGLGDLLSEIAGLGRALTGFKNERLRLVGEKATATERQRSASAAATTARAALDASETEVHDAARTLASAVSVYPAPTLLSARRIFEDAVQGVRTAAEHLLRYRRSATDRLEKGIEDDVIAAGNALSAAFADTRAVLTEYAPQRADDGHVSYRFHGARITPYALSQEIQRMREAQELALREDEDKLYEDFFLNELSSGIRDRIDQARGLETGINALLASKRFGNGALGFSVKWKPKEGAGEEYNTLVKLLRTDLAMLPDEKLDWIREFFRKRIAQVRADEAAGKLEQTYAASLREVFDYRKWFDFQVFSQEGNQKELELRGARFRRGSGAQKALGVFCPLVAAAYVRFAAAGANADAPRVIGLDEAFAGVDPANMDEMIRFLVELEFSVVMTSEKLWGTSRSLPASTTYDLQATARYAAARLWLWDGAVRHADVPAAGTLLSLPIEVAHVAAD